MRTLALSFIKWHPSALKELMRISNFVLTSPQERHLTHILQFAKHLAPRHSYQVIVLRAPDPHLPSHQSFLSSCLHLHLWGITAALPHSPSPVWTLDRSYHMFLPPLGQPWLRRWSLTWQISLHPLIALAQPSENRADSLLGLIIRIFNEKNSLLNKMLIEWFKTMTSTTI